MRVIQFFSLKGQKLASQAFVAFALVAGVGLSAGAWAQSESAAAAEESKILRLEGELRTLLGRIEQLEFEVQQLKNAQDAAAAVSQNQSSSDSAQAAERVPQLDVPTGDTSLDATPLVAPLAANATSDVAAQTSDQLTEQTETLAPTEIVPEVPLDLSTNSQTANVPIDDLGQVPSAEDADALYGAGFQAILTGDFAFAEEQFRQFLALYEDHEKTPDATHWLGESLLQQSAFGDAAEIFQKGYEAHETSDKAPDMLLKLGIALARGGEQEIGCRTYKEVAKRYPETSNAFKARLDREIGLAKCSAE